MQKSQQDTIHICFVLLSEIKQIHILFVGCGFSVRYILGSVCPIGDIFYEYYTYIQTKYISLF